MAYYWPREGSKDKKEWLTFRPRIRLGMCILHSDVGNRIDGAYNIVHRFDSLTKMATDCIAGCCCESFIMMGITKYTHTFGNSYSLFFNQRTTTCWFRFVNITFY
jgi:hypothetical protein